jgi:flagellar capping protein FliD
MTTTSASSGVAAATTTNAIDVSAIVASLISGEKKPLDLLTASVTKTELVISDLASMKSKIATLQNALNVFEDLQVMPV